LSDREFTVGCEFEPPVLFVDEVVMACAEWQEVGEVGVATDLPGDEVMDLAACERCLAGGEGAAAVDRP